MRRRLTPQRKRPGLQVYRRAMVGEQGGTDTEGKAPSSRSSSSNEEAARKRRKSEHEKEKGERENNSMSNEQNDEQTKT